MSHGRMYYLPLFLIIICLFSTNISAGHADEQQNSAIGAGAPVQPSFDSWLKAFSVEAEAKGISKKTLKSAFQNVKPLPRVIELDRNQPEFKLTFDQYHEKVIDARRIKRGQWRYQHYLDWIKPISEKYGVAPEYLIALWGMETDYGRLTGGFRVIDALATLAYDGRRSSYFRQELLNALQIIDDGHISADGMKGSWAGAMGQTQFMPSTFLAHAVDYDGDRRKNVWKSREDALASGANYLAKEGWVRNQIWGVEVTLPDDFDQAYVNDENRKLPIKDWLDKDVKVKGNSQQLPPDNTLAGIVVQTGEKKRSFMVFTNYYVVMKWNRSHNFAASVGLLADKIKQ